MTDLLNHERQSLNGEESHNEKLPTPQEYDLEVEPAAEHLKSSIFAKTDRKLI